LKAGRRILIHKSLLSAKGQSCQRALTITDNRTGKTYEIPIAHETIKAMDLRQIKTGADDFGLMSYDPAFMNTASTKSAITYLDGDKGILRYRGYPIEQLAENSDYLETAYLICRRTTTQHRWKWITTYPSHHPAQNITSGGNIHYDAHPMGMFTAPSPHFHFYPETSRISDPDNRLLQIKRLIAKVRDCRLLVPPLSGPALQLPRQRPQLHRQLPEHDVQDD
jgi:citrate synthase